jgi:hypothetical protein
MYQAHAIQSIQIVLLLINEQGGETGSWDMWGVCIERKYDIMKGEKKWSLLNDNNNQL